MKIPAEAREHIKVLDTYEINDDLETCNLVHLYDRGEYGALEEGNSQGFVDSKMFDVWIFDFEAKQKRKLEFHDELWFPKYDGASPVEKIRIFADGSTLVRFSRKMKVGWGQSLQFDELQEN